MHIDHNALAQLPHDGNLSEVMSVSLHHAASSTEEQISTIQESDPYDAHLTRSFVPNATRSMTEQETIRHSLHKHQSQQPLSNPSLLMWPTIGGTPINEFTTEGYFTNTTVPLVFTAQFSLRAPSGSPHNACISTSYYYFECHDRLCAKIRTFEKSHVTQRVRVWLTILQKFEKI